MRSRALRVTCGALSYLGIGAAAVLVFYSEQQIGERRALVRAFDLRARETTEALADVRAAQQAYIAAGQGVGFWMPKVDATIGTITNALAALQASATSAVTKSALDEAKTVFAEFGKIDARVRSYIDSGAQLMAADVVFAEGGGAAATTARQVERARLEEHQAVDALEAARRKLEALAAAGAAGLAMIVIVMLTPRDRRSAARRGTSPGETAPAPDTTPTIGDLMLRQPERPERGEAAGPIAPPRSLDRLKPGTLPALRAAAQLCTDLGRVNDPEELNSLLARAAEVLDASGLVLWLGTETGSELRPALAHGYGPETLARMPVLSRSANNAAAAAYRTGALQIVLSRPGSSKGAVVAPVLSYDGCVGVLSAEVRDGGEASDTVQALAAIFAAQLASMLSSPPATRGQRATGGGAV